MTRDSIVGAYLIASFIALLVIGSGAWSTGDQSARDSMAGVLFAVGGGILLSLVAVRGLAKVDAETRGYTLLGLAALTIPAWLLVFA